MKRLVEIFVRFPFYANLIILILVVAGFLSMVSMKMSFFPETKSKFIFVTVYYPGASPVEMEEGVTSRIEEAVRGIVGIREITSTSSENFTRVSIETTGDYNIDETLMDVKNAVDGISSLPTAAERPIVFKQRNTTWGMFMRVTGDVDLVTLKEYAQQIEEDFMASGVMSQVSISGFPPMEISVEAKEETLLRYGITFDQLAQAISSNNRDVSGGLIRSQEEELLIRLRSRSSDANKIGDIVLKANTDGGIIRIRDVAEVKKKFADEPTKVLTKGKPMVSITVNKLIEEDLEEITEYAQNYLEEFNAKDLGVRLEMSYSFLEMLRARLQLLYENGLIGLVLVVLSLALMLSFRLSLWVAWGIPSAFLAMFIVANMVGVTINMISLFGMILVIGILVDDGIVIGENIFQHFEAGKGPMRAAIDGTMEVMPAVVTSISTTIVAFTPLFFLTGQMEFLQEMAFVVSISLAFSLIEAFFVLPAHLGNRHVLSERSLRQKDSGLKKYTEGFFTWLRNYAYDRVLRLILEWRYIVIGIPIALFLITGGLIGGQIIKTTIFPRLEFDQFNIDMAFTPGSGEKQTMEHLEKFDKIIWEINQELMEERGDTVDVIDNCYLVLGSAFNGQETGSHAGSMQVFPRNPEETGISTYEIVNLVRAKIGVVPKAEKFTIGGQTRFGKPVSVSLLGRNLEEIRKSRDFLVTKLEEMPQLKDVVDNNALGKQEVRLNLKPKAYMLGLNEAFIANQVRQGFYGGQAQRLQEGRDELRVWVRYPSSDRMRLGQLERMRIKTQVGEFPLTELADYHLERGPVSIQRYNGKREIRVSADLSDPDASVTAILEQVRAEIIPEIEARYPGISIEFQGQSRESQRNVGDMMAAFPIAFGVIIILLMINFKSFEQPFLILIMIPLAILGSVWGHGIHGKPVSLLSLWGIVALTGVIINDAVVFLAKYNLLITQGKKVAEAIIEAGKTRLRPILLTTLTTSLGLYPLILEKSFQAQFLIPMAISLVYGVAIGTLFILLFFPALIMVLNDFRRVLRQLWTGRKIKPEHVEIAYLHSLREIGAEERKAQQKLKESQSKN